MEKRTLFKLLNWFLCIFILTMYFPIRAFSISPLPSAAQPYDLCICFAESPYIEPFLYPIGICDALSCYSICETFLGSAENLSHSLCFFSSHTIVQLSNKITQHENQLKGIYSAFERLYGGKDTFIYEQLYNDLQALEDESDTSS
ncbi:hypothetical protein GpartN1_g7523.t1 [Galdieria partita]|uniref:Uncharacterized protein n=1 Tax=Galdieria partita TaxID=83374 RepID=A0A9C7Q6W7_9RHOD|nr:hypothetical protein GpartN1_g7523.t1 [Galdieria partita]